MFMSQNTYLGRVSILFYLFGRGIVKTRPVSYVKNITRISRREEGDFVYTALALLSMYAGSGKMSYEDFYKSLMAPLKTQPVYRKILESVNTELLGYLVGKVSLGQTTDLTVSAERNSRWWGERSSIIRGLEDKAREFVQSFTGVSKDAKAAAKAAICTLVPGSASATATKDWLMWEYPSDLVEVLNDIWQTLTPLMERDLKSLARRVIVSYDPGSKSG